jgi:Tfp pilus assembly protein PilX
MKRYPDFPNHKMTPVRSGQQGVVLFFTLIALVVMSLAALALIRSVDTGTMIAGNLAFKQSATTGAEAGIEAAVSWLEATQMSTSLNVLNDPAHPFNNDDSANGYYSSFDPALSLTDSNAAKHIDWGGDTKLVGTDRAGNEARYVIQRLCRVANTVPTAPDADCLYASDSNDVGSQAVPMPPDICSGSDCPVMGESPQYVITVRVRGPRGTESFVQNFVN